MLDFMADQPISDPTRVLARLQAHAVATRFTDPRFGDLEPLRWINHAPVLTLIRYRATDRHGTVIAEIPGTGPIKPLALVDARVAKYMAIHRRGLEGGAEAD